MSDSKTQRDDLRKSKEVIRDFLDRMYPGKSLDEQLSDFRNFDFMGLQKYPKYGDCTRKYFDPDDTFLARNIYFLLWYDAKDNPYALLGLNSFSDIGAGTSSKYGGETINTYKTLFGKDQWVKNFFNDANNDIKASIKQFKQKHLTIGNFMILPSKTIKIGDDFKSINNYRGDITGKYRDYFDLSLKGLFGDSDENMLKLQNVNQSYFTFMNEEKGRFCKTNFLEAYFENDGITIKENLFSHPHPNTPYCRFDNWWNNKSDDLQCTEEAEKEKYHAFAMNYTKIASAIIDDRAERICVVLRERLG